MKRGVGCFGVSPKEKMGIVLLVVHMLSQQHNRYTTRYALCEKLARTLDVFLLLFFA